MFKKFLLILSVALSGSIHSSAASYSGTLPVLFINTEGNVPITSKENYTNATYYLDNLGLEGYESIGSKESPLPLEIRGRGNYTWTGFDKKPYRIKLGKKAKLLGMNSSKHFALLAQADDIYGFMRNITGFELSRLIGLAWTPADAPVEVVLNGDYIGLYFLTETIRVDEKRVNIVEQPDEATGAEEVTGGWLMEIDNYDSDPHITLYEKDEDNNVIYFTYKTPEILSTQQTDYIFNNLSTINDAIYNPDVDNNDWENYIDAETLAKYYIVQEIVDDYESFHGSCYLHKDIGENTKWFFGPVWDFGSAFNYDKDQFIYQGREWHNTWIEQICKHPHFIETVKDVWTEFYNGDYTKIYTYIQDYAAKISEAAKCDAERWPSYGNANIQEKLLKVEDKLKHNTAWLASQWTKKTPYKVYFKDNGIPAWEKVSAYAWYTTDDNVDTILGGWPGTPMTYDDETATWSISFDHAELPDNTQIIFNNTDFGEGNQTNDLPFVNNGLYNRNGFVSDGILNITSTRPEINIEGRNLIIKSEYPTTVTISDLTGRAINTKITSGDNVISLNPGFYIINGSKVIIK